MKQLQMSIILAGFYSVFFTQLWAQEFKSYKGDNNDAKIDRLDNIEKYLEGFSAQYKELQQDFAAEKKAHQETRQMLEEATQKIAQKENKKIEELLKKVTDLETKLSGLDVQAMKKDSDQQRKDFETLKTDYTNAKAMLQQIKLLIQADYATRLTKTDSSNNTLRGIVEEINKIQLPTATPAATPSATPTVTPTATVSATATPSPTTTPANAATPSNDNFLEKYPPPARQAFCRKPENLAKFKKECLPYL